MLAVAGDSGPTGDAFHDFVPDGSDVTETRDIIQTATDESADNDPKARWTKDAIIYTLDPVNDLQPGTYVASVQISDRGRPTDNNYRTPSVDKTSVPGRNGHARTAAGSRLCHLPLTMAIRVGQRARTYVRAARRRA